MFEVLFEMIPCIINACNYVIFNFSHIRVSRCFTHIYWNCYMNLGSIAYFVQSLCFYFKLSGRFYRNDYLHFIYINTIVFLWYVNIYCFSIRDGAMLLSWTSFVDKFSDGRPSNTRGQQKPEVFWSL